MTGAFLGVVLAFASGGAAAQMTGPIDTGTVRTQRIELYPSQPAQATPAPRRATPPSSTPGRNLDIKAFAGSFSGSGMADSEDTTYLDVSQWDLDVRITVAADGGFTIGWTTGLRAGSDAQPVVRRRAISMTFRPGPRSGLFTATENGDPLQGGVLSWARISRNTLTVHQFSVR